MQQINLHFNFRTVNTIVFLPRPSLNEFQKGETMIVSSAVSQKQEFHVGNWPLTFEELLQGFVFTNHIHGAAVLAIFPHRTGLPDIRKSVLPS